VRAERARTFALRGVNSVIEYRILGPGDASIYRDVRLRGFEDSPRAFNGVADTVLYLSLELTGGPHR
jgi:hypothetical protein